MNTPSQPSRLSALRLTAFSAPAVPLAILFVPVITYLPAFYSTEVGLSLSTVGAIFMITRIADALFDPLVGTLSDATRSRFGRRRVWLLAALIPLMVATYFLCNPPAHASAGYLLLWITIFYIAWSAMQVPYLSWGAELDQNYHGRSRVFGFRETGTFVGIMLGTGLPVLLAPEDAPLRRVLSIICAAALVALPIAIAVAVAFAKEESSAGATQRPEWNGLFAALRSNRPYVRFLAFTLLNYTFINMFNSTVVLLVAGTMKLPTAFLSLVFIQYVTATAIFIPLALYLAKRIGRHRVLALGNVCGAMVLVALTFLPIQNYWIVAIAFGLLGFISATVWALPPAIVGDVADYGALQGQEKSAGIYMAGYNLAVKGGTGLGIGIALPLLQFMGFQAESSIASTTATNDFALTTVGCLIPAAFMVLVTVLIWNFPINSRRHAAIRWRLERRLANR